MSALDESMKAERAKMTEAALRAERYHLTPEGGYSPHLEESRIAREKFHYNKNYEEVMHDYINETRRKIFLDSYLSGTPETTKTIREFAVNRLKQTIDKGTLTKIMKAMTEGGISNEALKKLVPNESTRGLIRMAFKEKLGARDLVTLIRDPGVKEYAYDYISNMRGTLGTKQRLFLNSSLQKIFNDPQNANHLFNKALDDITHFQYLTKIGLSWFRFPLLKMAQPILTTWPLVGMKHLLNGLSMGFDKEVWDMAREAGVIYEPGITHAISEAFGPEATGMLKQLEETLTTPARAGVKWGRVWSFASGLSEGKELGLKGQELIDHGVKLVDTAEFVYGPEGRPLATRTPIGRVLFQFRTFSSSYVNFLTKVFRTGTDAQKARAVAALFALSGTSALPFYSTIREQLLQREGIDIGEINPLELFTNRLGLRPGIDIGSAHDPFSFPITIYSVFGPTLGPMLQTLYAFRSGNLSTVKREGKQILKSVAPPITRLIEKPEVRSKAETTEGKGRLLGTRPLLERLLLTPSVETERRKYIRLISFAYLGRHPQSVPELVKRARDRGINMTEADLKEAQAEATRMRKE
jgi:hypothetical protein